MTTDDERPIWGLSGTDQDALTALLVAEAMRRAAEDLEPLRAALPIVSNREWEVLKRRFRVEAGRAHRKVTGKRFKRRKILDELRTERAELELDEAGQLRRKGETA